MKTFGLVIVQFFKGVMIGIIAITFLYKCTGFVLGADTSQRVQEATIGQQDRTVSPDMDEFEGYDNSDFLRDMDKILKGTYVDGRPEEVAPETTGAGH